MRLLVEIPEHLFAELELFLGDTALRRLDFTSLLRLVDVGEILGRGRMYFAFRPAVHLLFCSPNDRHGRRLPSEFLGRRNRRRWWRWCRNLLHHRRLNLVDGELVAELTTLYPLPPPVAAGS